MIYKDSYVDLEHPFISAYLWYMVTDLAMEPHDILVVTKAMNEWLLEHVRRDGKNNFRWSSTHTSTLFTATDSIANFSNYIGFTYEEDLLAFRLRWGINS